MNQILGLTGLLFFGLSACSSQKMSVPAEDGTDRAIQQPTERTADPAKNQQSEEAPHQSQLQDTLILEVDDTQVVIDLADNPTVKELLEVIPERFTMTDLHQNEKYTDLPKRITANEKKVQQIESGDVMLYGERTLVIFYESFSTPYSYTRIGRIQQNLEKIAENEKINVTIN